VAALEAFGDTLASLEAGLKGTLGTLAAAFLPGFQAVFDQVGGYLKTFTDIVSGADGDFGKIAEGLTGLVSEIATDLAAQAPAMLDAGLAIVQSILDAIISALPQLLTAAVSIVSSLVQFIAQALPTLIGAGVQILLMLVDVIVQNLPILIGAALQAIIALANGLAEALPVLIPAVVQAIITIVQTFIDNVPMLVGAALALILGLAEGLIVALPQLIAVIPTLIDSLLSALLQAYPMIMESGAKLLGMLATGIVGSIPLVILGISELIVRLGTTLGKFARDELPKMGKAFIQGLVDGMVSATGMLYDAIAEIVLGMIATIQELLGIASPSKVGRGIGANFISSTGLGAQDEFANVERYFRFAFGRLATVAANGSGNGGTITNSNETNNIPIYGNVIIQGDTPAGSLGSSLKGKRF